MNSINIISVGLVFITLIVIRFVLNISKYFYLRKVLRQQFVFLDGKDDKADDEVKKKGEKAGQWITENQLEIKEVVRKTGVGDQKKYFMEPLGLGYAREQTVSALDNLLLMNSEIMGAGREIISRAMGHYKITAQKSLNPLFWIEFVVFLPKELLKYFGVDDKEKIGSLITKIIQIIYWLASLFFMYEKYRTGN